MGKNHNTKSLPPKCYIPTKIPKYDKYSVLGKKGGGKKHGKKD